jgi:hypothetical protein
MPGTYAGLSARQALDEMMANAEATMQREMPRDMLLQIIKSSPTLMELLRWRKPLKPLLAHVAPNGNFNVPVVVPVVPECWKVGGEVPDVSGRCEHGMTRNGMACDWCSPIEEEPDILAITRGVARSG